MKIRAMIVCVVADVSTLTDEVAAKYGFEKVSEEFIGECKSRAVSFKHTKTGAEVMLMMRIKFSALFFALRRKLLALLLVLSPCFKLNLI